MTGSRWVDECPVAITVCDRAGKIIEMNRQAIETFREYGGRDLLGTSLLVCHPEPARSKLQAQLDQAKTNCYTIEKDGVKKLIYQAPWHADGQYGGIMELSLVIPQELPHFVRESSKPRV